MRALVIRDGAVHLEERAVPEPAAGWALLRVTLAGICGTDLELLAGYKGFAGVPGHELVGVVERADGSPHLVGKRVVGEINAGCGDCGTCARAGGGHCPDRRVLGILGLDGGLAEHVVLPVANLHVVPDGVPDRKAVFVEPLAAACRILEQVDVGEHRHAVSSGGVRGTVGSAGCRVVVVGAGRLGALCALVLRREGAVVEAVARNPRVSFLLEGAGVPCHPDATSVAGNADVVVDATGTAEGLRAARSLVRPRGTLVLKSTCAGADDAVLDSTSLVVDEITVVGSRCGPFDRALDLLESGAIDPEPLIDDVVPLADGVRAFETAARPGALKVLVAPGP